jgi:hypothetical protein
MSTDIKHEDKIEVNHHEGQLTPPTGRVGKIAGMVAPREKAGDGDMGARWLEEYTGDRPELSDEENKRVRNRIDRHLMPMLVVQPCPPYY